MLVVHAGLVLKRLARVMAPQRLRCGIQRSGRDGSVLMHSVDINQRDHARDLGKQVQGEKPGTEARKLDQHSLSLPLTIAGRNAVHLVWRNRPSGAKVSRQSVPRTV